MAYYPIIEREVDELLAKSTIEPSTGSACFYSNVFVVHSHTGGLYLILNPTWSLYTHTYF